MKQSKLQAGAAQRVITPRVGVRMAGWHFRAAGDNISRFVHDDLYVKALTLRQGDDQWALLAADLAGVDAVATAAIREGIAAQTPLRPEAILVCATHCHSGPVVCPVASATSPEELGSATVRADGSLGNSYGQASSAVMPTAYYAGEADMAWRETFVRQAIEAGSAAHGALQPAEMAFGEARVEGLASSRRVLLSDGTWADPRRGKTPEDQVVSRTEIDPAVRVMLLRELDTQRPLAAVINYASHPWLFSISGFSAELAGATCERVAAAWGAEGSEPPVVLYTTGPQGDVTLIWNLDIENLWKTCPGESPEESLARRERAFDAELARLSGRLSERVMAAIARAGQWDGAPGLASDRRQVALPLKAGYRRPAEVRVAEWQQKAPESQHLSEVQALKVGDVTVLGLPGEPFTSLGMAIRAGWPPGRLLIAALANDFGAVGYTGDRAAYELGGYELTHSPMAAGAGEVLVEGALTLARSLL